jgi:REP element-mobilizing transposase RayT
MKNRKAILIPGGFYHIYNRAIGDEVIFKSIQNYEFFLNSFRNYVEPVASICAFCLMPNHFHFIVQVKPPDEVLNNLKNKTLISKYLNASTNDPEKVFNHLISKQFSNFFNSYAQAYNNERKRKGNLFIRCYNRIRIDSDEYFKDSIVYVHLNPIKSGMCFQLNEWRFSSYRLFVSKKQSWIDRDVTIDFFDDLNNFIFVHQEALTRL